MIENYINDNKNIVIFITSEYGVVFIIFSKFYFNSHTEIAYILRRQLHIFWHFKTSMQYIMVRSVYSTTTLNLFVLWTINFFLLGFEIFNELLSCHCAIQNLNLFLTHVYLCASYLSSLYPSLFTIWRDILGIYGIILERGCVGYFYGTLVK